MDDETFSNTILGVAIGDTFGAGIEFCSAEYIKEVVDFTKFPHIRGGGYEAGRYTDDTEMTLAVMHALTDERELSVDLLMEHFETEYLLEKERTGKARPGHGSIKWVFEGETTIEEVRAFQAGRDFPGCAPPMRAIPFGFLPSYSINNAAEMNANSTHPHPRAVASSVAVARAAEYLIVKNGDKERVINYVLPHIEDLYSHDYFSRVNELPEELDHAGSEVLLGPQPFQTHFGTTCYGVQSDALRVAGAALHILKHTEDPFEGLKKSMYVGGDVDSLGAIVVGILAGRNGLDDMPSFLTENIENKDYLLRTAKEFKTSLLEYA